MLWAGGEGGREPSRKRKEKPVDLASEGPRFNYSWRGKGRGMGGKRKGRGRERGGEVKGKGREGEVGRKERRVGNGEGMGVGGTGAKNGTRGKMMYR